jgi:predicted nucleic acid-binding protein
MVLVDTSVWVDHLRRGNATLARLLEDGAVATHAFVQGELSLGAQAPRAELLALFGALPAVRLAAHDEVLELIERRRLYRAGIGWVDVHLVASALLDHARLWTLDRRLAAVAGRCGIGFAA